MKRILCIFLSLILCAFILPAFAEEAASEYAGDEISVQFTEVTLPEVVIKEASQAAASSADTVVNQNNLYTIRTASGLNVNLNASSLSSFIVLTQSYYASLDIYSRFNDDKAATDYINNLIDKNIHIVIWDAYDAFSHILLMTLGTDTLAKHVKNLAELSESDINAVARQLALANSVSDYTLYTFNGNVWIQLAPNVLVTIVNSEYQMVQFGPKGDKMTDDDYADFTKFLRALTLS